MNDLLNELDGFIDAVRAKAVDAIDQGAEALHSLVDWVRNVKVFATADSHARLAKVRVGLLECQSLCGLGVADAAPVGAWDGSRVLKLIQIAQALLAILFPAAEAA